MGHIMPGLRVLGKVEGWIVQGLVDQGKDFVLYSTQKRKP